MKRKAKKKKKREKRHATEEAKNVSKKINHHHQKKRQSDFALSVLLFFVLTTDEKKTKTLCWSRDGGRGGGRAFSFFIPSSVFSRTSLALGARWSPRFWGEFQINKTICFAPFLYLRPHHGVETSDGRQVRVPLLSGTVSIGRKNKRENATSAHLRHSFGEISTKDDSNW